MIRGGQEVGPEGLKVQVEVGTFHPGLASVRLRDQPVRAVVLHHTGGEGGWERVCKTLKSRQSRGAPDGLSVHFVIDRLGTIVQTADLDLVTLHAGRANGMSVGIEITSAGHGHCHPNFPREHYYRFVRGRNTRYLKFYSEQMKSAIALTKALCAEYNLPYEVPRDFNGKVSTDVLTAEQFAGYRGVLGHLHITNSKIDPSLHLLEAIGAK